MIRNYTVDDTLSISYRIIDNVSTEVRFRPLISIVVRLMLHYEKLVRKIGGSKKTVFIRHLAEALISVFILCGNVPIARALGLINGDSTALMGGFLSQGWMFQTFIGGSRFIPTTMLLFLYRSFLNIIAALSVNFWNSLSSNKRERMIIAELHIKSPNNDKTEHILYLASMTQFVPIPNEESEESEESEETAPEAAPEVFIDQLTHWNDEMLDDYADHVLFGAMAIGGPKTRVGPPPEESERANRWLKRLTIKKNRKTKPSENGVGASQADQLSNVFQTMIGAGYCVYHNYLYAPTKTLYMTPLCNTETIMYYDAGNYHMPKWNQSGDAMPTQKLACNLSKEINRMQRAHGDLLGEDVDPDHKHFALRTNKDGWAKYYWSFRKKPENAKYAACKPNLLLDQLLLILLKDVYAFVVYTKTTDSIWMSKVYFLHSDTDTRNGFVKSTNMFGTPDDIKRYTLNANKGYRLYSQDDEAPPNQALSLVQADGAGPQAFTIDTKTVDKARAVSGILVNQTRIINNPVNQPYFDGSGVQSETEVVVLSERLRRDVLDKTDADYNCLPLYMNINAVGVLENFIAQQKPL